MTLATNAPRLIGDKSCQLAQIESVISLADFLLGDLDNLVVKSTGHIPENHKPLVLESITCLNLALVQLYESIQQGD